jgi:hypothetical protein
MLTKCRIHLNMNWHFKRLSANKLVQAVELLTVTWETPNMNLDGYTNCFNSGGFVWFASVRPGKLRDRTLN